MCARQNSAVRKYMSRLKYVVKEAWKQLIYEPVVELLGGDARQPRGTVNLPTPEFIRSEEYQKLMNLFVPFKCDPGRNEAVTYTRSYVHRHHTCFHRLGVWRWRGMQRKATQLLSLFEQADGRIIDLGGAGCPVGMEAVVVDRLSVDKAGGQFASVLLKTLTLSRLLFLPRMFLNTLKTWMVY